MAAMMRLLFFLLLVSGLCFDRIHCGLHSYTLRINYTNYYAMKGTLLSQGISEGCKHHSKEEAIIRKNAEFLLVDARFRLHGFNGWTVWARAFKIGEDLYWKEEKVDKDLLLRPDGDVSTEPCMDVGGYFREYHERTNMSGSALPPSCTKRLHFLCTDPEIETTSKAISTKTPTESTTQKLDSTTKATYPQTTESLPGTSTSSSKQTSSHATDRPARTGPIETTSPPITRDVPDLTTAGTEPPSFPTLSTASTFKSSTSPLLTENLTQSKGFCYCTCPAKIVDIEDSEKSLHETIQQLKLNANRLSATVRRHTSAYDSRPSACFLSVPILLLVVTFLSFIVSSDVVYLYRYVTN